MEIITLKVLFIPALLSPPGRGGGEEGDEQHRGSDNFHHHPITEQAIFVLYTEIKQNDLI